MSLNLSFIKKHKWDVAVIVVASILLVVATGHSFQDGEQYTSGILLDSVMILALLIVAMNIINLALLLVHLFRHNWIRLLVTMGVMVVSMILWIIALIYIDKRIPFLT